MPGDIFGSLNEVVGSKAVPLASDGQRPGTLLSILHRTVPIEKDHSSQYASSAEVEKPSSVRKQMFRRLRKQIVWVIISASLGKYLSDLEQVHEFLLSNGDNVAYIKGLS